eukprot:6782056-Alexandrium_andersonii.AAC.1
MSQHASLDSVSPYPYDRIREVLHDGVNMTTAFSGMGVPEIALKLLGDRLTFDQRLGGGVNMEGYK